MNFSGKNILLVSPEPWDHIRVSKHHYAIHLAQLGAQVIFLNPPSNKWQLKNQEQIQVLDYKGFVTGIRYLPSLIRGHLVGKKLTQIEKYCNVRFDIVWSFDTSVFIDFSSIDCICISHLVDLNQNLNLNSILATAEVCFYNSDLIGNMVKSHNIPAYFINHGYYHVNKKPIESLPGQNQVKVAYAGNLSIPFIAWDVLYGCAQSNVDVDFLFIGPIGNLETNKTIEFREKIRELSNVYFLGQLSTELLQGYYDSVDALIICYGEDHYDQASNPHKLLEYLGSGKPVIASRTRQYLEVEDDLIAMSHSDADFQSVFNKVIKNIDVYNSPEFIQQRKELASANSYVNQLKLIEQILLTLGHE